MADKKGKYVISIKNIIVHVVALCLILNIGCVYTHINGNGQLNIFIAYVPAALLIFLIFLERRVSSIRFRSAFISVVFMAAYLSIYAFVSQSALKAAFAEICLVCILLIYYLLVEKKNGPSLLKAYRNLILIIAMVSLFFWTFGSVLRIIPYTSVVWSDWGASSTGKYTQLKSYFMLHFESETIHIFKQTFVCNRAIFVERAFAAFAFEIGWLYELFIEKNPSRMKQLILTVAMISTLSITGLIVVTVTFMLYYVFNGTNDRIVKLIRLFFIPAIILIGAGAIFFLLKTKMSIGISYSARIRDFRNGFSAWLKNPLFGYGYGNSLSINRLFNAGYSNSVSMILTQGGCMLAIIYITCFVKGFFHSIQKKDINKCLFIVAFVLSFSVTAIAFTNIVIYLLMFLFVESTDTSLPAFEKSQRYVVHRPVFSEIRL